MATGSRSSDRVNQIWCALSGFLLCSWFFGELRMEGWLPSGISINKVGAWSRVPDLCGWIWGAPGFLLPVLKLLWLELGAGSKTRISFNKAAARCHRLMWSGGGGNLPFAGRGGEERKCTGGSYSTSGCWRGSLLMRLCGSSSLAALHRWQEAILLLNLMAVRQPLPRWSPADWRTVFYLRAFVPDWRPSSADAVCSRRSAPSGHVSGGGALDCDRLLRQGFVGEGARRRPGLDCFSYFCSRVFSANSKGHVVIFSVLRSSL